jgi:hypothetical protein
MYLNLSWNQLFDTTLLEHEKTFMGVKKKKTLKKKDDFVYSTFDPIKDKTDEFNKDLSTRCKKAIENLCHFIKRNNYLIHADFSHTGLNE